MSSGGSSFDGNPLVGIPTDEEVGDASNRDHAWQPSNAVPGFTKKRRECGTVWVPIPWKIDANNQQILRWVSGILTLCTDEALREEHGPNEEHHTSN